MMIKRVVFSLLFVAIAATSFSQTKEDACKQLFIDSYDQLLNVTIPEEGKVISMIYDVRVLYNSSEYPNQKQRFKVLFGKDEGYLDSDDTEYYFNSNTVVSIFKKQNTIFVSNWDSGQKKMDFSGFIQQRDSLMGFVKAWDCTEMDDNLVNLGLEINDTGKSLGITELTYIVDKSSNQINTIRMSTSDQEIMAYQYDIISVEKKNNGAISIPDLMAKIFNGDQLKEKYKSYKLIDKRK